MSPGGALVSTMLAAGLVLSCSERPSSPAAPRIPPAREGLEEGLRSPTDPPKLALGFVPGSSVTERRIAAAQAALRADLGSRSAHVELATLLWRRARETSSARMRQLAQDVLDVARARWPRDRQVRLLTAVVQLEQHRFRDVAQLARQLIEQAPGEATAHLLLGDALLELGDYDGAIGAVQVALGLRPDLRSYNRAAYLRWLIGDTEGALEAMDLAVGAGSVRDPESMAWCFVDLGVMFLHQGRVEEARGAAREALARVEGYVPALVLEARALDRSGETEAALATLLAAVERRPTVEDLLFLTELAERSGELERAAEARSMAEELSSHDPRPLAHFFALRGEQPDRALRLARKELEQRDGIWARDTLALALWRVGRIDEAKESIERALALGTPVADFHLHAGLIEAAAGRPEAAAASLERARQFDPGVDPRLVDELRRSIEREQEPAHA